MKTIVVPCDFSQPSKMAFEYAMDMAAMTSSQVIVLYVIYIPLMYDPILVGGMQLQYDPAFLDSMEKDARAKFEEMKLAKAGSGVILTFEVIQGDIVSSIINTVQKYSSDLVVMGTTGASALREAWIGSTTEKVVRNCPVPVISIHDKMDPKSIKKILLPSILTLNQTAFMNKVKSLQSLFGATLEILLVNTPVHFSTNPEAKEKFESFISQYQLENCNTHFKNFRTEEEGILHVARERSNSIIAMATHARKGLSHLFQGSITEDLVNHLPCPVWTFPIE